MGSNFPFDLPGSLQEKKVSPIAFLAKLTQVH